MPVYVHAKVGIVDDRWLTVGSANLNEHSLFNDTEVNVVLRDEQRRARRAAAPVVGASRARRDIDGDPSAVIDECWRPLAKQNASTAGHGKHRLSPRRVAPREALLGP